MKFMGLKLISGGFKGKEQYVKSKGSLSEETVMALKKLKFNRKKTKYIL